MRLVVDDSSLRLEPQFRSRSDEDLCASPHSPGTHCASVGDGTLRVRGLDACAQNRNSALVAAGSTAGEPLERPIAKFRPVKQLLQRSNRLVSATLRPKSHTGAQLTQEG